MKKYYIQTKDTNYNAETGISTAWIATDLGDFYGEAKLAPEDKDIASSFAGCRYAEMRAIIKYSNLKVRILKAQLQPLIRIKNNYEKTKAGKLGYTNKTMTELNKEIQRIQTNLSVILSNRENIQRKLKNDIDTRPEAIEYILNNRKKKQGNE